MTCATQKTSRYTLFTFLPRILYEQFRRVPNFYFAIISVLQVRLAPGPARWPP